MAKQPTKNDASATGPDADPTAVQVPGENNSQGKEGDAVKDLPPANPLGEPVKPAEEYPNISEAGKQAAALGVETEETRGLGDYIAGETTVEHPVSPTDTNPNPHGQRRQDGDNTVVTTDPDTKVSRRESREDGEVEVTGLWDNPVHLGDGRTLPKGETLKVSKEVAKDLRERKAVK